MGKRSRTKARSVLKKYSDRATQGKMTTPMTVRDRNSGKKGMTFRTGKCCKSLQTTNHQPLNTNEADEVKFPKPIILIILQHIVIEINIKDYLSQVLLCGAVMIRTPNNLSDCAYWLSCFIFLQIFRSYRRFLTVQIICSGFHIRKIFIVKIVNELWIIFMISVFPNSWLDLRLIHKNVSPQIISNSNLYFIING